MQARPKVAFTAAPCSAQVLHLGNNNIGAFPPALRVATALRMLYLANQRSDLVPRKVRPSVIISSNPTRPCSAPAATAELFARKHSRPLRVVGPAPSGRMACSPGYKK